MLLYRKYLNFRFLRNYFTLRDNISYIWLTYWADKHIFSSEATRSTEAIFHIVMYKTMYIVSLFTRFCNIPMFYKFDIAFYLSLRKRIYYTKRICSLKDFEFAPKEFAHKKIL